MQSTTLESYLKIVNKAIFDSSELKDDELPPSIAKQYLTSDQHAVRQIVAQSSDFCDETRVFPDSIEAFDGHTSNFPDANVVYPDMQVVYPDTNTINH